MTFVRRGFGEGYSKGDSVMYEVSMFIALLGLRWARGVRLHTRFHLVRLCVLRTTLEQCDLLNFVNISAQFRAYIQLIHIVCLTRLISTEVRPQEATHHIQSRCSVFPCRSSRTIIPQIIFLVIYFILHCWLNAIIAIFTICKPIIALYTNGAIFAFLRCANQLDIKHCVLLTKKLNIVGIGFPLYLNIRSFCPP